MKKPNQKDQKYYAGHIFLDQKFMNDVDTYVSLIEKQNKELIEWLEDQFPITIGDYEKGCQTAYKVVLNKLTKK